MAKPETINIRLSAEEKAKAKVIANAEGLTISAYLRRCILFAPMPDQKQRAA